jgi:hypothetical protein
MQRPQFALKRPFAVAFLADKLHERKQAGSHSRS